jgi:hypothetical protein
MPGGAAYSLDEYIDRVHRLPSMIASFACKETARIWSGCASRRLPGNIDYH